MNAKAEGRLRRLLHNPWIVLVLSLLTLGAFSVYWHYAANHRLRSWGEEVRPALSALAISWGALILIPWLFSCATTANRVAHAARTRGIREPNIGVALLLLPVWGYAAYLQSYLNRIAAAPASASF
jgi:hypothetical protein